MHLENSLNTEIQYGPIKLTEVVALLVASAISQMGTKVDKQEQEKVLKRQKGAQAVVQRTCK
jgi:hypothetical protein